MNDAASGATRAGRTNRISRWSMSLGYAIAAVLIVAFITIRLSFQKASDYGYFALLVPCGPFAHFLEGPSYLTVLESFGIAAVLLLGIGWSCWIGRVWSILIGGTFLLVWLFFGLLTAGAGV